MTKKNKVGKPTTYKPEYCQMLIEHMGQGLSIDSFPSKLGHGSRQLMYEWMRRFPEFFEAKQFGECLSLYFWEVMGRDGACGKIENFNATTWFNNMKNRFGWRDQRGIELTDSSGVPINPQSLEHKNFMEFIDFMNSKEDDTREYN